MTRLPIVLALLALGCSEHASAPASAAGERHAATSPEPVAASANQPEATIGGGPAALEVPAPPSVRFRVERAVSELQIDVRGEDERDVRVQLYRLGEAEAELVAFDDDSGEGQDARMTGFLPEGDYEVRVQEYGGRPVRAEVEVQALAPLEVTHEVSVGGEDTLIGVTDAMTERDSAAEARFEISEEGEYSVVALPIGNNDPKLRLLRVHSDGRLESLGFDDDSGRNRVARVDYRLPPGEYRVRVFSSRRNPGRRQVYRVRVGPREPLPASRGRAAPVAALNRSRLSAQEPGVPPARWPW